MTCPVCLDTAIWFNGPDGSVLCPGIGCTGRDLFEIRTTGNGIITFMRKKTMTKPIYLIHGPMASGKTRNAEKLQAFYGCDRIVELDEPRHNDFKRGKQLVKDGVIQPGDLVLTNRDPADIKLPMTAHVIHISEALKELGDDAEPVEPVDFSGCLEEVPFHPARDAFRVSTIWATEDGDKRIAYLARVSNSKATPDMPSHRLISYLLRNKHWSPLEMASACLEIRTQRDISAQILRHRSFSFQEFSTRYAEVEELLAVTECRWQDPKNRQSSRTFDQMAENAGTTGEVEYLEATIAYFDAVVNETRVRSLEAYQELLRRGVAKEVARRILPIGLMPTKLYMTGTVRSWLHYLSLRLHPHTQKEHRMVAFGVYRELCKSFPDTVGAAYDEGLFNLPDGKTFDGVLPPGETV